MEAAYVALIDVLLIALRAALADTGEHRLYKSGKLDGLFTSKNGTPGDAAAEALREGFLETVRTERQRKDLYRLGAPDRQGRGIYL